MPAAWRFWKCREPDECRCDFPFRRRAWHRCRAPHISCSNPLYRRAIRVSMGNVFQVPWTVLPGGSYWPEQGIAALQELGFYTVAMALKEDSVPMDDPSLKTHEKLAILLGTEGDGLASDTIAETDATVLIPMTHGVDSLNVAAASAVAFWELAGRR